MTLRHKRYLRIRADLYQAWAIMTKVPGKRRHQQATQDGTIVVQKNVNAL